MANEKYYKNKSDKATRQNQILEDKCSNLEQKVADLNKKFNLAQLEIKRMSKVISDGRPLQEKIVNQNKQLVQNNQNLIKKC